jgi:hypothetical protein
MPRIHDTIWGAPKTSTVPIRTPTSHHQLMRPNQASAPVAITAMTATGVRMLRMAAWPWAAPAANGLANEDRGASATMSAMAMIQSRRFSGGRVRSGAVA